MLFVVVSLPRFGSALTSDAGFQASVDFNTAGKLATPFFIGRTAESFSAVARGAISASAVDTPPDAFRVHV